MPLKSLIVSLIIIIIIDIHFLFTGDSYRAHEPNTGNSVTFLPVVVSKSARIASRVELVVVPLTVEQTRATSLPLPPNVPEDDVNSPPYASKKTFAMSIYYHEDVS